MRRGAAHGAAKQTKAKYLLFYRVRCVASYGYAAQGKASQTKAKQSIRSLIKLAAMPCEAARGSAPQSKPKQSFMPKIKIESLVRNADFYPRTQVSKPHVDAIANAMRMGVEMPPIKADKKTRIVIDGWHRLDAHETLGLTEIEVEWINCKNEAEIFALSVEANADHGRPYTPHDRARIQTRAEELGLQMERVSHILRTPLEVLAIRKDESFAKDENGHPVALKGGLKWKAGATLTPGQVETNRKAAGMGAAFFASQLVALFDSDLINWNDQRLVNELTKLHQRLSESNQIARSAQV